MRRLLIADDDVRSRARLARLLTEEGYEVLTTGSAAHVIEGVLKNLVAVVILGGQVDGLRAAELISMIRRCKTDVKVILASEEETLPSLRRLRREGIFYYLLKPLGLEDVDEVKQVVHCAFENLRGPRRIAARA